MSLLFLARSRRSGAVAHRTFCIAAGLIILLLGVVGGVHAQAGEDALPRQMLFLPIPLDPLDFGRLRPVSLVVHDVRLPDGRRGALYRFGFWTPVGANHAASVRLDYVGLEKGDAFQYGGGRTTVQWTSRVAAGAGHSLALDLTTNLPTGVNTLHPLSAQAPSVQLRLRLSPLGGASWRLWLGWWARRLSQPSAANRVDPRSWFPSGSGVDAFLHGRLGRHGWEIAFRQDLGGLPETSWVQASWDFFLAADLGLRLGAATAIGPPEDRPMDHLWMVGVVWLPGERDRGERDPGHASVARTSD